MSTLLEKFKKEQEKNIPDIRPGDTLKIHQKIKEGEKERIQIFEGIVIARKHGTGISATITVRKIVDGVGVERIYPMNSPSIEKIEVVRHGKVRRSKLYYLRTAKGKKARLKRKDFAVAIADKPAQEQAVVAEETPATETTKTPASPSQGGEDTSK